MQLYSDSNYGKSCDRSLCIHIKLIMKTARDLIILLAITVILAEAKLYQAVAILSPAARYHLNDLYDGAQTKDEWG